MLEKVANGVIDAAVPEVGKAAGKAIAGIVGAVGGVAVDGVKVVGGAAVKGVESVTEGAAGALNYAFSFFPALNTNENRKKRSISKRDALARAHNKNYNELIKELREYIDKNLIKITDQQLEAIMKYWSLYTSDDTSTTKKLLENTTDEHLRATFILDYMEVEKDNIDNKNAHISNGFYEGILDFWIEGKIFQEYFIKPREKPNYVVEIDEQQLPSSLKP